MIQVEYVRQERVEGEVEFEPAKQGIGHLIGVAVHVTETKAHELVGAIQNDFGQTEYIPTGDITVSPAEGAIVGFRALSMSDCNQMQGAYYQREPSTGRKPVNRSAGREDRAVNCFLSHGRSTIKDKPQFIQDLFYEGEKIIKSMK